jgi:hypothetical protein
MYGSIRELMSSNQLMPGEERFTPEMQEKMQPALPPVRKAAEEMLERYIAQLAPSSLGV